MALMPIGRLMGWLAEQHPDCPAITFESRTLTRLELEHRTNRLARAYFRGEGVEALRQELMRRLSVTDPQLNDLARDHAGEGLCEKIKNAP